MMQRPNHPPAADERALLRSSAALFAVAIGVALCVKAGIPLLVPAAYLIGVFSLERQTSTLGYILVLCGFVAVAIAIGFIWSSMAHVGFIHGLLVTCGLIFAALGRLRRPPTVTTK